MAITFFSINGAGGGGGGGSTVNTNNGISGDGSVGTPVVLGGKPLTADTTIVGAGHALSIITDNATDKSEIDISHNSVFTGTTVDSSGDAADLTTLNAGGILSLDAEVSSGANVKRLHMSRGGGGTGIIITDTIDNEGLTAASLFPVGIDPNRYVQQGNLVSLGGNTSNGISGNGSVSSPIVLGGNPLTIDTTIDVAAHKLEISSSDIANTKEFLVQLTDTVNNTNSIVDVGAGNSFVLLQTTDLSNGDNAVLSLNATSLNISAFLNEGARQCGFQIVTGTPGIQIIDTQSKGLFADAVYPLTGDSTQYLQEGNVQRALNSAAQDTAGQTTTQVIPPAYTPLVDSIIRINAYALYITGVGSVAVTVVYTDRLGASVTALLGTISSGTPHTAFPATILKVKGGTTVSVTYTVTGVITYDAGATIENLFT